MLLSTEGAAANRATAAPAALAEVREAGGMSRRDALGADVVGPDRRRRRGGVGRLLAESLQAGAASEG